MACVEYDENIDEDNTEDDEEEEVIRGGKKTDIPMFHLCLAVAAWVCSEATLQFS